MAETANIATMAEIISEEILLVFGWKKVPPMNENWSCVMPEHGKRTHPSDVVFKYFDPYRNYNVYVNCDLKSYASGSITKAKMSNAIESLCITTECANVSPGWSDLFTVVGEKRRTVGLLFIYNHDGQFDVGFNHLISQIDNSSFNIRDDNKVYIIGPKDVCFLNTIANDVCTTYGRPNIQNGAVDISFHYPDLELEKLGSNETRSASVEMLLSNMIVFDIGDETIVYLKTTGEDLSEFEYLLDYLVHYQKIQHANSIKVKVVYDAGSSTANFSRAKRRYCEMQRNDDLEDRLNIVTCSNVQNVVREFNSIEIGMD